MPDCEHQNEIEARMEIPIKCYSCGVCYGYGESRTNFICAYCVDEREHFRAAATGQEQVDTGICEKIRDRLIERAATNTKINALNENSFLHEFFYGENK